MSSITWEFAGTTYGLFGPVAQIIGVLWLALGVLKFLDLIGYAWRVLDRWSADRVRRGAF